LITGTVREVTTVQPAPTAAAINGWRNTYATTSSATNAPVTTRFGRHNFMLQIPVASKGVADIPQGFGYGWIQIARDGTAAVTGKLSDGTDFSSSAAMGPNGEVLVFMPIYANLGSVLGTFNIAAATTQNPSQAVSGNLTWRKPLTPAARLYPTGIGLSTPLSLTAIGGLYTPPLTGQLVMGITPVVPPTNPEFLRLTFAEGGIIDPFAVGGITDPATKLNVPSLQVRTIAAITMPAKGTTLPSPNPASATLTIIPSTG